MELPMNRVTSIPRAMWAFVLVLAALAVAGAAVAADSTTVWLKIDSESERQTVRFSGPLEWLATAGWDADADRRITVEGIRLDLRRLWRTHRDLAAGEEREIDRGITEQGEPYVVRVTGAPDAQRPAEGKMRIMIRDEEDEVTDLRFPLNVASFLTSLLGSFPLFGQVEEEEQRRIRDFPPFRALEALDAYGPFVLFEVTDVKPRARIAIE
ncbi:MAG: hypothetical protein GF346_09680 [Candidatus Eisenbacteria bacterium]|nr:hypothetical protein [Candidatus Latescibacterota bacterium]MBD3302703.1 hypothetical protein [Candidatus Eisenbacteria bacterium]